jgi:hypothetical protein
VAPELSEAVIALLPEGRLRRRFQTRWLHDRLRRDLAMESLDCGARGRVRHVINCACPEINRGDTVTACYRHIRTPRK